MKVRNKYDYLIVGAGPFGSAFARTVTDAGKTCLVIDKRHHVAGNAYTKRISGIDVHMYGAHIFHTDSERIWRFVNEFSQWRPFKNNPKAIVGGRVFSFPINLMTLHQLWGVTTPAEAQMRLRQEQVPIKEPRNAEEWLLSQVGKDIYELFFYGYTKKQWQKDPKELPASIVRRLPFRLTYDDSYFHAKYQAVPARGYTVLFEQMLSGIPADLGVNFFDISQTWRRFARTLVFTGPIDRFFGYSRGRLEYRSLRFEFETHRGDFQGHAVFNYPDESIPYLRSVEHKHFLPSDPKHFDTSDGMEETVVSYDYPLSDLDDVNCEDPQYPIRDERNTRVYREYAELAKRDPDVLFGGRLGEYQYYDIDQAIGSAISKARRHMDRCI